MTRSTNRTRCFDSILVRLEIETTTKSDLLLAGIAVLIPYWFD